MGHQYGPGQLGRARQDGVAAPAELPRRLAIVASDLDNGRRAVFGQGPLADVPLSKAIAVHALVPPEDRVTFDEPLARQSIRVGVALASCGLMRAGSSRQRHLAQSTIDLCWERVPVFRAGKDDRAMAVLLARAAAWEIAITNIVHVGASGAGQVAKAANQIVTGMGVLAVAEAFAFASKNGVDPAKVREALLGGFAYSRILENHGQRMLDRNFKPGFKSWMHEKDLNIVMQTAHQLGLCLPGSAATAQMFNAMVGSGLGEEDSIAVLKLLERLSGQEARDGVGNAP